MIVKYKYRHGSCGNVGWYQADTEDIKKLFKNQEFMSSFYWMVVDMGNDGEQKNGYWVYSMSVKKWYFRKNKAYWF